MSDEIIETKALVPVDQKTGLLAPADLDGYWRMAQMLADSGMVPDEYRGKPQAIIVSVQMGRELGLSTNQSLQSITVIKGKPSVYADGLTGLLNGSGLVDDWEEKFVISNLLPGEGKYVENEVDPSDLPLNLDEWPDNLKAVSTITRKNRKTPSKGSFSVADAKRQGTWNRPVGREGKKSVWQKHPARMLMWRARTYAARDGFSDVLKGLHVFEEVIDYDAELEDSNGHYEVKETPKVSNDPFDAGFWLFCKDHGISGDDAKEFVEHSAAVTEAPVDVILAEAYQRSDDFKSKLSIYVGERDGKLLAPEIENQEDAPETVAQMDNTEESGNEEDPFQDPPPPEIDDDGFSADMDPGKKEEILENSVETPEIRLNSKMYILFNDNGLNATEKNYVKLLQDYVDYVSELTNKPRDGLVEKFLETDDWFEFFLGWVETDFNPDKEGKDMTQSATEDSRRVGTGVDAQPAQTDIQPSDRDQGAGGDQSSAPASPGKSTIKEWIGMRGVDFEPYVEANPGKFDGIPKEEYDRAVSKWNSLVYKRTQKPWPGLPGDKKQEAREGAAVEFPELNQRQVLHKVKKKYPGQTEAARVGLGFAQHVTDDEAAERWIKAVKHLVNGGSVKDLKQ